MKSEKSNSKSDNKQEIIFENSEIKDVKEEVLDPNSEEVEQPTQSVLLKL